MAGLITKVRKMIADPASVNQQFTDDEIQERLDSSRDDVWYEQLTIAPSVVNNDNTHNQPQIIFADYYSRFSNWEAGAVLQANNTVTGAAWVVVTPTSSDYLVGHWTFEDNVFIAGVAPGQYPPVFCTGKIFDPFLAAADLLEFWAATLTCAYDFSVDGRSFHRAQMMQSKLTMAQLYRRQAKPKVAKLVRGDVNPGTSTNTVRLLGVSDNVRYG